MSLRWSTRSISRVWRLPPDVTGSIVSLPLADSIKAARAVVPDLSSVAFVGSSWDRQIIFRNWKDEIPTATAGLNVIEIIGATMAETRKRVEALPERSAILYSAMYSDGEDRSYPPTAALKLIADKANRPIIAATEPFLQSGSVGGFVLIPAVIGARRGRAGASDFERRIALEHSDESDGGNKARLQLAADAALERQRIEPASRQRNPVS